MSPGRITQNMIFDKTKYDLNRNLYKLQKAQNVISTGKRVSRPSDDPISAVQIMKRKVDINRMDMFIKNTENAKTLLNQASSVLVEVTDQLDRAKEISLTFANDPTNSQDTSNSAKLEVENILSRVINLANTKENGRSIFAGTKTLTQPFEPNDKISEMFKGNMGKVKRQISSNATMTANTPGVNIFSDGVFQALVRLSEAVDTESPRNEVIADTTFSTSEISANFTENGSSANKSTVINDLDQLTTDLSDGDTITISGKDSNGYSVEETFTYGADNDGNTLENLRGKIEEAYNAFGNSTATIDNGKVTLDSPENLMPAPELAIKFNDEDTVSFVLPEFNNTEINQLDQVTTELTDGDTITISGIDSGGNNVEETFTYGENNDGTTLGDFLTEVDTAFGNSTVEIDDNGYIRLVPEEDTGSEPSLSLEFKDEDGNGSAITLPQFTDKMTDAMNKLDKALNKVSESQADLGSKINRLDDNKDMLEDVKLNITELLSKEEDANMAEAITEFSTKQNVYQAALNASIRIMQQPTLLDFLR